jgi:hypothetical protein
VAAIWISGLHRRMPSGDYEALGGRVMHYATAISRRLIQPSA